MLGTYRAIFLLDVSLSRRVHAHLDWLSHYGQGCWSLWGCISKRSSEPNTGLGDRAELAPVMSYSASETNTLRRRLAVFGQANAKGRNRVILWARRQVDDCDIEIAHRKDWPGWCLMTLNDYWLADCLIVWLKCLIARFDSTGVPRSLDNS